MCIDSSLNVTISEIHRHKICPRHTTYMCIVTSIWVWNKSGPIFFGDLLECFHTRADSKWQWQIVIAIFELPSVHTRESRLRRFCGLAFQGGDKKRGSFFVFFWNADCSFIWDRISIRKCAVYRAEVVRRSRSSAPLNHNLEGQGNHTAILLRDLRDASLENTSGQSFELHNSKFPFVMLFCVQNRPKYRH